MKILMHQIILSHLAHSPPKKFLTILPIIKLLIYETVFNIPCNFAFFN